MVFRRRTQYRKIQEDEAKSRKNKIKQHIQSSCNLKSVECVCARLSCIYIQYYILWYVHKIQLLCCVRETHSAINFDFIHTKEEEEVDEEEEEEEEINKN